MQKIFSIIVILIAVSNVIYSFFSPSDTNSILTIEMDIWIYRLIWSILAGFLIFGFIKQYKGVSESKDSDSTQ